MEHHQRKHLRLEAYDYSQDIISSPSALMLVSGCSTISEGRTYVSAVPRKISLSTGCGNYRGNSQESKSASMPSMPDHIHLILVIPGGHAGPPYRK